MKKLSALFLTIALLFISGCADSEHQVTTAELDKTEKTAAELMETVMNSVHFPQMIDLTDTDRIAEIGIDLTLAEDHAIKQQMLSVDVSEVIIIKVKEEENIEKILDSLNSRKDSLINDFAFYPEQVEAAEATVVGGKKDVVYLICHADADTAEEKLLDKI